MPVRENQHRNTFSSPGAHGDFLDLMEHAQWAAARILDTKDLFDTRAAGFRSNIIEAFHDGGYRFTQVGLFQHLTQTVARSTIASTMGVTESAVSQWFYGVRLMTASRFHSLTLMFKEQLIDYTPPQRDAVIAEAFVSALTFVREFLVAAHMSPFWYRHSSDRVAEPTFPLTADDFRLLRSFFNAHITKTVPPTQSWLESKYFQALPPVLQRNSSSFEDAITGIPAARMRQFRRLLYDWTDSYLIAEYVFSYFWITKGATQ